MIYVWLYFSTFSREIGHFIFAKLVDMSPYFVRVGTGYKFLKLQLFNTMFELGVLPSTGITYAYHSTLDGIKWRIILFKSGGIFADFILLALLIIFWKNQGSLIIWIFIIIQALLLLDNLIPAEIHIGIGVLDKQVRLPNDMKQIISALMTNHQKNFKDFCKEYNKLLYKYKDDKEILPTTFLSNDLITLQILIKNYKKLHVFYNFEETVEFFLQVLKFKNISNLEKIFILDSLANIVVMKMNEYKKYLNAADKWSQEAIGLASHSKTVKRTRGAILIELGRYEEGKQLLLPLTQPENEALDIAVSSCYIAKAEYFLGNIDKVQGWLIKAKRIGVADADNILKRIQQEISYSEMLNINRNV